MSLVKFHTYKYNFDFTAKELWNVYTRCIEKDLSPHKKKNTLLNAEQCSPLVERKCLRNYLVSFKQEEKNKNHTHRDTMQYKNIKFLLWNCCQVRHFIKNYDRVSMTARLNAEKGPSNSGLKFKINSNSVKRLKIKDDENSVVQSFPFSIFINT